MAFSEVIKMTAVPSAVDTTHQLLYLSVVLSPELSGGTGTLAGTDFENWPDTLRSYTQNTRDDHYYPASWDVVVSDGGGSTLFEEKVGLDPSGTDAALWGSLFPPTTSYELSDSAENSSLARARTASVENAQSASLVNDRFRAIPIISYPATQIMDFVTGQYQHYSPTEVPTFETISAVYAPVTAGLIGVVGQETMQAQARARQARSLGGTVAHADDFTDATTSDAFAAFSAYQKASSAPPAAPGVSAIDFHAALTFIGQHGVLQRALGLVFDIVVPYGGNTAAENVFGSGTASSEVYVSVSLYSASYGLSGDQPSRGAQNVSSGGGFNFTQVSPRTQCDANSTTFTAHSLTGSIVRGILDGTDPSKLKPVPLSIVGDVNATSKLPYKLLTIQRAQAAKGDYTSGDFEQYQGLYVPPPSLRSAGITLAQVSAGLKLADQLVRSYAASDAASAAIDAEDGSQLYDFGAEDLVRGYVLDLYDTANGVWRSTGERNVTYSSGSASVSAPTSEPFDEAAVQAPPRIVYPPDVESEQFVLSEILLSYNGWSNAVVRPGTPVADNDFLLGPGSAPFDLTIAESVPPARLPPLRFGHTYRLRVRVIDAANNKVSVSDPANDRQYTEAVTYARLEPIASPDLFPQSIPRPGEALKRLVIRDVDVNTPSVRALYPQRVSEQFAEAHGQFDNSSGEPDPSAYATIVPRESGQYPDPPTDGTQPPTIGLNDPVPFLPDPLARGAVLTLGYGTDAQQSFNIDFSPQNGASWPDYRPFGLELTAGSALGATVDQNRRVITFTLTPADDVTIRMSATHDPEDVPLLGLPSLFPGTPDPRLVAAGHYWAVTPAINLQLTYAVQKPLATPEFSNLAAGRSAGDTAADVDGELAWSPKSTAEVDISASWSEPVDNPALNELQGPGTPNPALRETSGSPVATVSPGNTQLAPGSKSPEPADDDQAAETDPLSFTHEFFDTKHRVVTYSGVASSAFAECYPDGTPVSVSTAIPVAVNVLSSAPPEPPLITDVIPIYEWSVEDTATKIVSQRAPSALRVFMARPWWTSGIGELLGVTTFGKDGSGNFSLGAKDSSDWAADPVFSSGPLPAAHPKQSSFPNAVRLGNFHDLFGTPTGPYIAGHAVAFDPARDSWYCDIKVDTGPAYTPMIRLALARWQPDSLQDVQLSKVVMTQIMSLEPGRTVTVVRGGAHALSSVQLTGYSYHQAADSNIFGARGGVAQVQVERRDRAIHDEELGWQLVGNPITMQVTQKSDSFTTWTARNVRLRGSGPHRLIVTQFERLPGGDSPPLPGQSGGVTYAQPERGYEYRLVHQDIVQV